MYTRYAIYFVPDGIWGDAGAEWLGWDCRTGTSPTTHVGDSDATARPRKYGFHATLKAPFRLAAGAQEDALITFVDRCATSLGPISLSSLQVSQIGKFYAFTAQQEQSDLIALSSTIVHDLDPFRAALTDADIARRRASRLSAKQDALMLKWGYPYVMDEFRFHLTLTGPIGHSEPVQAAIATHFEKPIASGLQLDSISLVGERDDGFFEHVHRAALA